MIPPGAAGGCKWEPRGLLSITHGPLALSENNGLADSTHQPHTTQPPVRRSLGPGWIKTYRTPQITSPTPAT